MTIKSYIKQCVKRVLFCRPSKMTIAEISKLSENEYLLGRNALITGGTSGIGYAIADAFINAGANVVITGRDENRIAKAINNLKSKNTNVSITGVVIDNSKIPEALDTLNTLLNKIDIDILVNNAGVIGPGFKTCTEEQYQLVMDTNLKGAVFITRAVSENMIKKQIKGNILNVCSSSSLRPANSAYVLSKWGMRGYTLGLAKSLIKHDIVVNGIAPGPTATPMLHNKDDANISLPSNPSGRYAMPEEIANIAVILTSTMGRMIVGDIVYITGGAGVITFDDINY